ncbi:MAG: LPS export ABC transporter ATP-binding protein [Planctomycetota bacterium]
MLEAHNLSARFRGRAILDGVTLSVEPAKVVGLLGPNGAGKTTCFRAILGQVALLGGRVILHGEDISSLPMHLRARRGIGYLPQEASIFRGLTVADNILCVLQMRRDLSRGACRDELEKLMADLRITRLADSSTAVLSGGERRRCELARALAANPRYMLLDEPFAGVDPVAVGEIQRLVAYLTTRGIGVLVTDHNVREALKLCDSVYTLSEGRVLASGSPDEIIKNEAVRELYLGDTFEL